MGRVMLRIAAIGALLLTAACASTPQATRQDDALAKEFLTHPSSSTIYVYRSPFNHHDFDSVLYLNGRIIGMTYPGGYFRIDAVPGYNVLHGTGIDLGELGMETRPGQLYIVQVDVNGGHSNFRLQREEAGKRQVRDCCALFENWAPGQRPVYTR